MINNMVIILNELLKADPEATNKFFNLEVDVNKQVCDHPTIQVITDRRAVVQETEIGRLTGEDLDRYNQLRQDGATVDEALNTMSHTMRPQHDLMSKPDSISTCWQCGGHRYGAGQYCDKCRARRRNAPERTGDTGVLRPLGLLNGLLQHSLAPAAKVIVMMMDDDSEEITGFTTGTLANGEVTPDAPKN